MTVQATIEQKIRSSLTPSHLEVINESHMHKVPPGSEMHFKVIVVSDHFDGASRVKRQQAVNHILADEFAAGLHALSMHTLTPDEWQARNGAVHESPPCHGASKDDG
jgi:BolA family transcriptional regulator, general stress-responsive regulator